MTTPFATEIGSILVRLAFSFFSRILLLPLKSLFLTDIVFLLLLVSGEILLCLRNLGVRKKTHSVLDALDPRLTCISSPNLLNWNYLKFRHVINCSLVSNVNTPLSTYKIQNSDKRLPFENLLCL